MKKQLQDRSGQATVEYILLLFVILSFFALVSAGLNRMQLAKKLTDPLRTSYARAYRYGDIRTKGFDDGGPEFHARVFGGDKNFRLWLNSF